MFWIVAAAAVYAVVMGFLRLCGVGWLQGFVGFSLAVLIVAGVTIGLDNPQISLASLAFGPVLAGVIVWLPGHLRREAALRSDQ